MPTIYLNDSPFDVDLVVFDKDGTLLDFAVYWGSRTELCTRYLVQSMNADRSLADILFRSLGYDPEYGKIDPLGPLATATMQKIYTIATVVLYQHGITWDRAEALVRRHFAYCMGAHPTADLIRPLGPVHELFTALVQAGIRVAVITTDDRKTTYQTLRFLSVDGLVCQVVTGNEGLAMKPAPDALLHVAEQQNVALSRIMMVGDTVADLQMARDAGVRVGVLSGVSGVDVLAPYADILLPSIAEIRVPPA